MIISQDIGYNGRMGNQMFIYAALLALKNNFNVDVGIPRINCENNKDCAMDMYHNKWIQSRCVLYDYFNLSIPIISENYPLIYQEKKNGFNEEIFKINSNENGAIKGYFQSWKYFEDIKDIVKKEFQIKNKCIKNVQSVLDGVKNKVCIHIRLGDFLGHQNIFKLNPSYISNVLNNFSDDEYNYIIFSDNFEYILDWFPQDNHFHFMKYNEIESLYLMTQCDHFIISPSTFSWWGAYLGEKNNTRIYSPDWWYNDIRDMSDLHPSHWNICKTS